MMDIITISDDESESPPPKKKKVSAYIIDDEDPVGKLNSLKEISAFPETEIEVQLNKRKKVEDSLTIIIESDIRVKAPDDNQNVVISVEDDVVEVKQRDISTSGPIVIDDESDAPEEPPPPSNEENETNGRFEDAPSTSTASEAQHLLNKFLETCAKSLKGSPRYETAVTSRFQKLRQKFNECANIHEEAGFKRMLQEHIDTARFSAPDAVICFQRLLDYLLDHIKGASVEVSEDNLRKLRKIEKTMKKIQKKIKILEESEVDFDDEENSTFIQTDRYIQRLMKLNKTYNKLLNRNEHTGRLTYEKIQFVSSKNDLINRAISKTVKKNKFPSYCDIEQCVRRCVDKHGLAMTEAEIKEESKHCFGQLGNLLQQRRKKELYEVHCGFITLSEDPANNDAELRGKLQKSQQIGDQKMRNVVEKYVRLQEGNVQVELSEDSDDSNYKSSEEEDDDE